MKAFSEVIDIHSQNQSPLINKANYQIQLIDRLASIKIKSHKKHIEAYQSKLNELKTVKEELNKIFNGGLDSKRIRLFAILKFRIR